MFEQQLSEAIACVYDAAVDPNLWPDALARIVALLGRGQGCLEHLNYDTGEGRMLASVGYDTDAIAPMYPEFIFNDPWAPRLTPDLTVEHALGLQLLSDQERRMSFFANELAPLVGMETKDVLATFITRACERGGLKQSYGALMVYAGENQDPFDTREIGVMRLIRPHLIKALEIQARLDAAEGGARLHLDRLDRLGAAVWMLDAERRVHFANARAAALHAEAGFILEEGGFALADPDENVRLQRAITQAQSGAAAHDRDAGAFLAFPPGHRQPLSVLVAPLSVEHAVSIILGRSFPSLLVIMSDRNPKLESGVRRAEQLFDLTAAEAKVLRRFMDGLSVAEIAEDAGVSAHTIRTQVKSIMGKTDTHAQRELVALVTSVAL